MIQRYTFLNHPFYFVLQQANQMINGLDKCVAVFYNNNTMQGEALVCQNKIEGLGMEDISFIDKIRSSAKTKNWIKPNQVPFETKLSNIEQLSFEDEEQSSVLQLGFLNPVDNKMDILYFYFKQNIANFKLSATNQAMAVNIKEVIQNLLYNQINIIIKEQYNNQEVHNKVAQSICDTFYKEKINELNQIHFRSLKDTYSYILKELTANEGSEYILSNSAVEKLSKFNLPLSGIKNVILSSLEVLINKYGDKKGITEINDTDIIVTKSKTEKSIAAENLEKTAAYLDKYEFAAKLLDAKNVKITGVNIGEVCDPPISAAAISDILKKHRNKMEVLMAKHPGRWSLIRTKFRPIKTISEKQVKNSFIRFGA